MENTIAAISTSIGEAGIGIVRMSGDCAIEIAKEIFQPISNKELQIEDRKLKFGHIIDQDEIVDEVLIAFMNKPKTYTREDMVEIYTHGSMISVKKVLDLVLSKGATLAERGEFTKRAFLNGRLDLSQAEAVIDIIRSKTEKGHESSLRQLGGSIKEEISGIRNIILNMLAFVEVAINFSEDGQEELDETRLREDGKEALDELNRLITTANKGKILREGIRVLILGKPNVGKSSLLNRLIRENRAIVTEIPGTTRDSIEEMITINGIAFKLIDTAGIRETDDIVEQIGVSKSIELAKDADLIVAIFDLSEAMSEEDQSILSLTKDKKTLYVLNKTDKEEKMDTEFFGRIDTKRVVRASVIDNKGIDELEKRLSEIVYEEEISSDHQVIITNVRHERLLKEAAEQLEEALVSLESGVPIDCVEVDLKRVLDALGEITGETADEEVINKVFNDFCIGK